MKISDEKLFELCKKYGTSALLWRRKFTGLLPEINRRRLYERKGFSSIFEFSFKLCGLSADQVNLALNLGRRFEDKPALKKILEEGEASIGKLSRIVSIATVGNQEELAEKVKILPTRALETLVRDERFAMDGLANGSANGDGLFGMGSCPKGLQTENQSGLNKPLFENESLRAQTLERAGQLAKNVDESLYGQNLESAGNLPAQTINLSAKRSVSFDSDRCITTSVLNFKLADDVKKELEELNSKGIDVNEFLRKALKQRKQEIEERKEEIAKKLLNKDSENGSGHAPEGDLGDNSMHERNDVREQTSVNRTRGKNEPANSSNTGKQLSRYVSAEIRQLIKEEHGTKCSIPNCTKPAEVLHHAQKFGLAHSHDPRFLAPLCEEHHLIAHSMDVKFHEMRNGFH